MYTKCYDFCRPNFLGMSRGYKYMCMCEGNGNKLTIVTL